MNIEPHYITYMKKTYFFKKLKPILFICGFLLAGNINLYAQSKDTLELAEDKVASIRDLVFNGFREKTGVTDIEFQEFTLYYQKVIARNMGRLFNALKKNPDIEPLQEQQYIANMQNGFVSLYAKLKRIKAEFPSSVAEAIAPRQPHHATGTCNPSPENLDFASGTLAGWTVGYASCSSEDVGSCPPANNNTPPNFIYSTPTYSVPGAVNKGALDPSKTNSYQISLCGPGTVNTGANDPIAGFPVVCPGYTHSCMVGDGSTPNYGVAILEQTFTVNPDSTEFYYNYAILLENPGHCYHMQPYFIFAILDQNGDTIPTCTTPRIVSGSGLNGWGSNGDWQYLNWTPGHVSLQKYAGQCVTVIVMTSDCGAGGHAGYAYFDASFGAGKNIISSSSTICGTTPIKLTAPLSGIGYKWMGPCINGSDSTQTINIGCAGTYSLLIKNGTCTNDTLAVIVKQDSTTLSLTISSSLKNDTVCPGSAITLTANGGTTYSWTGGITNGVPFSPSVTGKYVVTATKSGCIGKDSITVVAGTGALPSVTITSSPANDTVCKGSPVKLSGNGASYYAWSGGVTNAVAFHPSSSGKYFVTGTGTNGCSNTDSMSITVNPLPILNITSSPSNDSICPGGSITLTATGASNYSWSGGITNGVAFSPASTAKYVVTASSASGCSNKDSVTVVTGPNLIPNITIISSPKNDTICPGGSITLSGKGGSSYVWSGGVTNNVPFKPIVSGQYNVTGYNSIGCSSKDSVVVIAGSGALPTITTTSSPTSDTICKGNTVKLSASGAYYYSWSGGISNGVSFTPGSSGKYIVTGTGTNGCSTTDTVNVVVNPLPVITITGVTPVASGTPDTLTASGGVSYTWSTGSTNDTTIVSPAKTTTYTVTAVSSKGCSSNASFTVTIQALTGVININPVNGIVLYPNPANEILNLNFTTNGRTIAAILKIADLSGKQWLEQNITVTGNKIVPINISSLANGMYFISIETNLGTKTLKFIKE